MSKHIETTTAYDSKTPTWCPGCGDFGIWTALKRTLEEMNYAPHQVLICYDIGCSGNMMNFVKTYGYHGLHGRSLPAAVGARLANHDLPVIQLGGDGGVLGEGMGHFVHTARANPNLLSIVHDNQVYGLTKGQHSATARQGQKSPTAPDNVIDQPVNPVAMALSAGATFVARGFAGNIDQLVQLFKAGLQHDGFAFVDVLQPCVTFNHHNTYAWYRQRVYDVAKINHQTSDLQAAWRLANEPWDEKLATGILYQTTKPTLEQQIGVLKNGPLIKQSVARDITSVYRDLR